ncbi:hypothetical protein GCM10018777_61180 [Streptomyces albogriseolus]|nr:hypothetical protein GCM10018777_61180 [Streptomyces viridodiastaticus]
MSGPVRPRTRTATPKSTIRRRVARPEDSGKLRTHVVVGPRLLGIEVDATLWLRVPPAQVRAASKALMCGCFGSCVDSLHGMTG